MVCGWHSGMFCRRSFSSCICSSAGINLLLIVVHVCGGCCDEENKSKAFHTYIHSFVEHTALYCKPIYTCIGVHFVGRKQICAVI